MRHRRRSTSSSGSPDPEPDPDPVVVPDLVTETPPADRFCDLVLTGGVASGVVYPWAIVELARHFNFKQIGGTSVGAMAAALAAAAEYGRRCGSRTAFEVLRRVPGELAEEADGITRLQALFQTAPRGRRLFSLFAEAMKPKADPDAPLWRRLPAGLRRLVREYQLEATYGAAIAVVIAMVLADLVSWLAYGVCAEVVAARDCLAAAGQLNCDRLRPGAGGATLVGAYAVLASIAAVVGAAAGVAVGVLQDLQHGLVKNDLGLVRGKAAGDTAPAPGKEALIEWLHRGIQRSAGFDSLDPAQPPLTFRDLWRAPAYPGEPEPDDPAARDAPGQRAIDLQMVTSNITHGRPYSLPLRGDGRSPLFYRKEDLKDFFPEDVMKALVRASRPYAQHNPSDPPTTDGGVWLELPGADMPIVVAARLSLSFPLLLSSVPLYAIDQEMKPGERRFKLCRFSDGGICSNFPIHLFDAAVPSWPTFGLWLGSRSPFWLTQALRLPRHHRGGWGEQWIRLRHDDAPEPRAAASFDTLGDFLEAILDTAKDWGDRSGMRMPHVRTRVLRINQLEGEGGLNIAMTSEALMRMAHRYGTAAGKEFARNFVQDPALGLNDAAWQEHRWVRLHTLILSLRDMLRGIGAAASTHNSQNLPLEQMIDRATAAGSRNAPLRKPDGTTLEDPISDVEAQALKDMLQTARALEIAVNRCSDALKYAPVPLPELRVRPPL